MIKPDEVELRFNLLVTRGSNWHHSAKWTETSKWSEKTAFWSSGRNV